MLHLRPESSPELELFGEVPISTEPESALVGFPQTREYRQLAVDLENGFEALLVDCVAHIAPSGILRPTRQGEIRRQAWVTPSAALVGPWHMDWPTEPHFDAARLQVSGSDGFIAMHPISQVTIPTRRVQDEPCEWTIVESLQRECGAADEGAHLCGSWDGTFTAPNGFYHRIAFSPILDLELTVPVGLKELIDDWVTTIHHVVGLSTGRLESITYLECRLADVPGKHRYLQVFAPGLKQAPFASDHRAIARIKYAFKCFQKDDVSLLKLCRGWQAAMKQGHPLIETIAAFMYLPDQHPRPRFLLLCQALEGLYGFENEANILQRQEKYDAEREAALAQVDSCGGVDAKTVRFIKRSLAKRPFSSLEVPLREAVKALPGELGQQLERLEIVSLVREQAGEGKVHDWAEAFRIIRNGLSHGSDAWSPALLGPAAEMLGRVAEAHLMRLIGCGSESIMKFLDEDPAEVR